jgi:hypothetical protein
VRSWLADKWGEHSITRMLKSAAEGGVAQREQFLSKLIAKIDVKAIETLAEKLAKVDEDADRLMAVGLSRAGRSLGVVSSALSHMRLAQSLCAVVVGPVARQTASEFYLPQCGVKPALSGSVTPRM